MNCRLVSFSNDIGSKGRVSKTRRSLSSSMALLLMFFNGDLLTLPPLAKPAGVGILLSAILEDSLRRRVYTKRCGKGCKIRRHQIRYFTTPNRVNLLQVSPQRLLNHSQSPHHKESQPVTVSPLWQLSLVMESTEKETKLDATWHNMTHPGSIFYCTQIQSFI
jgi:hypothetical protein